MKTTILTFMGAMQVALLAGCGNHEPEHPESTTTTTPPTAQTSMPTSSPMSTSSSKPTSDMTASTTPPADVPKAPTRYTDAEVGAIMDAANGGEIEQAQMAQKSGQNAGVKSFASMMITHHSEARDKQAKLFTKASMTPSDNAKSRDIKADGQKIGDTLKPLKGAEFDKAYVDAQVKEHQTVLTLLDTQILPNVQNADYKTLLQDVRGRVEQHLKAAQELQTKLAK